MIKKFNVKVNGNSYEVEVEEIKDGVQPVAPAVQRPAAAPAPAPAAPTAAPAPTLDSKPKLLYPASFNDFSDMEVSISSSCTNLPLAS